jgi:predicted DNA-binding protein YlxM (UPF0122 family)
MDIETLPKSQKVVVAQVMLDLDYSATEIAKELKIDRSTVYRYGEKELPEDLRQFATEIKSLFSIKQTQIIAKILKYIEDSLETADLKSLIQAYEVIKRHTQSLYDLNKEFRHQERWDNLV